MKTLTILLSLTLCLSSALAADSIVGKNGETLSFEHRSTVSATSDVRADVEYNTTGTMDTPATLGGDVDFWGSDFVARWTNDTGADVTVIEFGWPTAGWWSQSWRVWITDVMPEAPWSATDYSGSFVSVNEDPTAYPPNPYTYIDVADQDIVIPADGTMYFGYSSTGMAGQVSGTASPTWSWLDDVWDNDNDYDRTTILQFKGTLGTVAIESQSFSNVKALYR